MIASTSSRPTPISPRSGPTLVIILEKSPISTLLFLNIVASPSTWPGASSSGIPRALNAGTILSVRVSAFCPVASARVSKADAVWPIESTLVIPARARTSKVAATSSIGLSTDCRPRARSLTEVSETPIDRAVVLKEASIARLLSMRPVATTPIPVRAAPAAIAAGARSLSF